MSQPSQRTKPVAKSKAGQPATRRRTVRRNDAKRAFGYDDSDGPKPMAVFVVVVVGLGFIAGGIAMITYSKFKEASQDFIIIGACMIFFGCLFLGMAFVFVVRPIYRRRRVQSAIDEKTKQEATLGVDEYIGSNELTVNVDDVIRQRRPSAVELYGYEDNQIENRDSSNSPKPPLVALPSDRHSRLIPTFSAPLPPDANVTKL